MRNFAERSNQPLGNDELPTFLYMGLYLCILVSRRHFCFGPSWLFYVLFVIKTNPKWKKNKKTRQLDVECVSYNLILSGLMLSLVCSVGVTVFFRFGCSIACNVKISPMTTYMGSGYSHCRCWWCLVVTNLSFPTGWLGWDLGLNCLSSWYFSTNICMYEVNDIPHHKKGVSVRYTKFSFIKRACLPVYDCISSNDKDRIHLHTQFIVSMDFKLYH